MGDGREVELKLEVEPAAAAALREHPLLAGKAAAAEAQVSVYFDTRKHKLRRAGYTLRVRQKGDGFTLAVKGPSSGAGLFDRAEWERPVAALEPDAAAIEGTPAGDIIGARGLGRLIPVVRTEVERTVWLLDTDEAALELVLDVGAVRGGDREQPLHEVEIEVKLGTPDAAIMLARRLAETLPLRLGVLSKAERGFALLDGSLATAAKAAPAPVLPSATVAEGFAAIVLSCLKHFRLNEPLVVGQRNAEGLHQARVAMRRLRSALTLFRPAIRDGDFERLRADIKWFTEQLGDARNLDVFLSRLEPGHPEHARLERAREQAYAAIVEALASKRFRDLMLDIVAWVETGAWRGNAKAGRPLAAFVSRRLDGLWGRIEPLTGQVAALSEEERHQLRIDIKKIRYALEFVAPLHAAAGGKRKRFMAALEGSQEYLGFLNDIATARQLRQDLLEGSFQDGAGESEERETMRHIEESKLHFERLRKAGPFWHA